MEIFGFDLMYILAFAAFNAALTFGLYFGATKIDLCDIPTNRKRHTKPVPLIGGTGIVITFLIGIIYFGGINPEYLKLMALIAAVFGIGFYDDYKKSRHHEVSARFKGFIQIVVAIAAFLWGYRFEGFFNPFVHRYIEMPGVLQFLFSVTWIFGLTTVMNFVDGLDGLCGGIVTIGTLTLYLFFVLIGQGEMRLPYLVLFSATLAFLAFNFGSDRFKVFMGDSGATTIGFIISLLTLKNIYSNPGLTVNSLFIPVLVFLIPIFDNFYVLYLRYRNKVSIFSADRRQVHYRLMDRGCTSKQAVFILWGITAFASMVALFINIR